MAVGQRLAGPEANLAEVAGVHPYRLDLVTVGQYAGIPLQDPANVIRHGGIFLLRKPPMADAAVSLDGWTTQVKRPTKAVVTFGPAGTSDAASTYRAVVKAANDGLDYLSARGLADVMIQTDRDDFVVWWPETAGTIMQTTIIATWQFGGFAEAEVRDADGHVKPSPPLTPTQHDAFRFIRMSRTSIYLYDSYRNMFLALESLLSDIAPQNPGEGEAKWFKRAIAEASKLVPIAELALPTSLIRSSGSTRTCTATNDQHCRMPNGITFCHRTKTLVTH